MRILKSNKGVLFYNNDFGLLNLTDIVDYSHKTFE